MKNNTRALWMRTLIGPLAGGSPRRRAGIRALLCAAFGVASGIALFLVLDQDAGRDGWRATAAKLGVSLLVALLVAAFVERVRARLHDDSAAHGNALAQPLLVTVLLLLLFEFFVNAFEDVSKGLLEHRLQMSGSLARIAGSGPAPPPTFNAAETKQAKACFEFVSSRTDSAGPSTLGSVEARFLAMRMNPGARWALGYHASGVLFEGSLRPLPDKATPDEAARASVVRMLEAVGVDAAACHCRVVAGATPKSAGVNDDIRMGLPGLWSQYLGGARESPACRLDPASDCAAHLRQLTNADRERVLQHQLNAYIERRDLFNSRVFVQYPLPAVNATEPAAARLQRTMHACGTAADEPGRASTDAEFRDKYSEALLELLARDRRTCYEIAQRWGHYLKPADPARASCGDPPDAKAMLDARTRGDLVEAQARLLPQRQLIELNHALLQQAFGVAEPRNAISIHWPTLIMGLASWIVAAGFLAWALVRLVFESPTDGAPGRGWLRRTTLHGLAVMAVAAGSLVTMLLLTRLLHYTVLLFSSPQTAVDYIATSKVPYVNGLLVLVGNAALWVNGIVNGPAWLGATLIVILVVALIVALARIESPAAGFLPLLLILALMLPLLDSNLLSLLLGAAIAWVLPALLLTYVIPRIDPSVALPRPWALVGAGLAALLVGLVVLTHPPHTAVQAPELVALAGALILFAFGLLVWLGLSARQIWPVIALAVGATAVGVVVFTHAALGQVMANLRESLHASASFTLARKPDTASLSQPRFAPPNLAPQPPADESRRREHEREVSRARLASDSFLLDMTMIGALGFWLTIAGLLAWSYRQHDEAVRQTPSGFTAPDAD